MWQKNGDRCNSKHSLDTSLVPGMVLSCSEGPELGRETEATCKDPCVHWKNKGEMDCDLEFAQEENAPQGSLPLMPSL